MENKDKRKKPKHLEIVLLALLAFLLCIAVWQVFLTDEKETVGAINDEEARLISILQSIDGVGETEVMIGESETGERGVVIVCEGANRLSVLVDVREAAATALGIEQKNVKIYLKNQ